MVKMYVSLYLVMNTDINNKITYQISGDITEENMKMPYNSDTFKTSNPC